MYYLTDFSEYRVPLASGTAPVFDFIRISPQEKEIEERRQLPEPLKVRNKPKIVPPQKQYFQLTPGLNQLTADIPTVLDIHSNLDFSLFGGRDVSPLVRIQPIYPLRARSRGIEGWVEVEFAIAKDGNVVNPVIIDAEPPGVFDNASLKAVSKWRYQPQVIDNEPVMRSGIRVVIQYKLEN